jgi:tetratricopeptide (TPR) repeat protein
MRKRVLSALLYAAGWAFASSSAPFSLLAAPRITFTRTVPAATSLGQAEKIAIAQAIGDHISIETFVGHLIDQLNSTGALQARDLRQGKGPADAYFVVKTYRCMPTERSGEGSGHDVDGNRLKRKLVWLEVLCTARIDVLSNVMKYQTTFYGKGSGLSPRVEALTDEERSVAYRQAARYAAIDAAGRITPRSVRESIALDESAPQFEEGYAMITADRLEEARRLWQSAIPKDPRSAALRFNLAAVCEALGDRRAAATHYAAARELAPAEPRYASELRLFARRGPP